MSSTASVIWFIEDRLANLNYQLATKVKEPKEILNYLLGTGAQWMKVDYYNRLAIKIRYSTHILVAHESGIITVKDKTMTRDAMIKAGYRYDNTDIMKRHKLYCLEVYNKIIKQYKVQSV